MWFKSRVTTPAVAAISFCLRGCTSTAPAYADVGDQLFTLVPDDGAAGDSFGGSVAISGATAIVGARGDDDNGSQSGSAYLFDAAAPGMCPWDLDASGSVGILDLLALLAVWSSDPVGPPDFDGDGNVGILDLLTLLANWGACA